MSKAKERINRRILEDPEFQKAYEMERIKLDMADLLFKLREQTGLNQSEFAKRVNKPRSTIVRIENATMEPSVSLINEIAAALEKKVIIKIIDIDQHVKS